MSFSLVFLLSFLDNTHGWDYAQVSKSQVFFCNHEEGQIFLGEWGIYNLWEELTDVAF